MKRFAEGLQLSPVWWWGSVGAVVVVALIFFAAGSLPAALVCLACAGAIAALAVSSGAGRASREGDPERGQGEL